MQQFQLLPRFFSPLAETVPPEKQASRSLFKVRQALQALKPPSQTKQLGVSDTLSSVRV